MATSTIKITNTDYELLNTTIFNGSNTLDISDYVNGYRELIFMVHPNPSNNHRFSAPICLPTKMLTARSDSEVVFETGSYATGSANTGDRISITKSSNTYTLKGEWSYREGGGANIEVTIYGMK